MDRLVPIHSERSANQKTSQDRGDSPHDDDGHAAVRGIHDCRQREDFHVQRQDGEFAEGEAENPEDLERNEEFEEERDRFHAVLCYDGDGVVVAYAAVENASDRDRFEGDGYDLT